jgi:hypothetical protein
VFDPMPFTTDLGIYATLDLESSLFCGSKKLTEGCFHNLAWLVLTDIGLNGIKFNLTDFGSTEFGLTDLLL